MMFLEKKSSPFLCASYCTCVQCYDSSFTRESFLTVIRSSETAEELIAVREKVEENIARWRSRDTGGSEGNSCS